MAVCDEAPLPSNKRHLIMMDHNCAHKKPCRLFVSLYSESWRRQCVSLEEFFGKKNNDESELLLEVEETFMFVTKW